MDRCIAKGAAVENAWKNIRFTPRDRRCPRNLDELVACVKEVRERKGHIKTKGGLHSMNHVFRTEDVLLDLRLLDQVSVDPDSCTAEVGGGITLGDAIVALDKAGLHFPSLGSWYSQSIAGAIATSTHGSSLEHGALSDMVEEVEAVLADGSVTTFAAESDELKALRAHLGQLGLVTRVKLKLTPAFRLACAIRTEPDTKAFASIVATAREHEFVNMLWVPYLEEAYVRILTRSEARARNAVAVEQERRFTKKSVFRHRLEDVFVFILGHLYLACPRLFTRFYCRMVRKAFFDDDGVVDKSYRVFLYDQYREPTENHRLRMIMNVEYALDVAELEGVLTELKALLARHRRRGAYMNYPRVHVRFAPKSERTLVGLNADRDTAYVGIYVVGSIRHRSQISLAEAVEQVFLDHGGRPHWGKYSYLQPEARAAPYAMRERFEAVRRNLDPDGLFSDGSEMFANLGRFERAPWRAMLRSLFDRAEYQAIRLL